MRGPGGAGRLALAALAPLLLASAYLRAWLDGQETDGTAQTRVAQAGTAGIYLTTEDGSSNVFEVLAAGIYAAG